MAFILGPGWFHHFLPDICFPLSLKPATRESSLSFKTTSGCSPPPFPLIVSHRPSNPSHRHFPCYFSTSVARPPCSQLSPLLEIKPNSQPPHTHLLPTAADHHIRRPAPSLSPIAGSFGLHHRPSQVSFPFSSSAPPSAPVLPKPSPAIQARSNSLQRQQPSDSLHTVS